MPLTSLNTPSHRSMHTVAHSSAVDPPCSAVDGQTLSLLSDLVGCRVAGLLLEAYGGLRNMYCADDADLLRVGLSRRKIRLLRTALQLGAYASGTALPAGAVVKRAADVAAHFCARLAFAEVEEFWALALDVRNRIILELNMGRGSLTTVDVHPRDVFRPLIRAGAAATIFVHNHPSGDVLPSEQDHQLTHRLVAVGDLVGICVLDHLIVGASGAYCSVMHAGTSRPCEAMACDDGVGPP